MERPHSRSAFLQATAAATGTAAFPLRARAQATKIRMAGVFSDPLGEPFYAKEAGAFARAGFDIEVSNIQNAAAVVAAVGSGSLELGIGDLISGVKAISAGVPVVLIAGSSLYLASQASVILAVANTSPIRTARELIGKVVAVPTLVGLSTASVYAWLKQNGVDPAMVKFVELTISTMVPALQRGTVDAAVFGEPVITASKSDVRDIGHPLDAIAKEFLISVWYATKSWIDADRERARRVVSAIYETSRWCNAHQAETMAILVRDGHLDGDKLRGMIRAPFATSLTPEIVQPVLNTAAQYKLTDKQIDANSIITRV